MMVFMHFGSFDDSRNQVRKDMKQTKQSMIKYENLFNPYSGNIITSFKLTNRIPSTIITILETNPEVFKFLSEFEPELDQIIDSTPKSTSTVMFRLG